MKEIVVGDRVTNSLVPDPAVGQVTELYTGGSPVTGASYAVVEYKDGRREDVPVEHLIAVVPCPLCFQPLDAADHVHGCPVRTDQLKWEQAVREELTHRGMNAEEIEVECEGFGQDWAEYREAESPVADFIDAITVIGDVPTPVSEGERTDRLRADALATSADPTAIGVGDRVRDLFGEQGVVRDLCTGGRSGVEVPYALYVTDDSRFLSAPIEDLTKLD